MPKFTAARSDHTFVDEHDVTVHYYVWRAGRPKAIVQLAHGLGEYAARYEEVAQALVAAGYTVYADDHRGHGRTGLEQWDGDRSKLGRLGEGGLAAATAAVHQFTGIIRAEHPALPIMLLGHSWGSLMAQKIVARHADEYAALVLTGTAYRMPGYMNAGDLNKPFKHLGNTGFEWLSRDKAVAKAFLEDPLTFYADVLKLFGVLDGLRLFGRPGPLAKDLPILIMVGSEDSLGGERSALKLAEAYAKRSGVTDIKAIAYPGGRHEVFNETNRSEVVDDLITWLDERIP